MHQYDNLNWFFKGETLTLPQTLSELSCDVEHDDVINLLMRAHNMEEELLEEQLHNVNSKFELE